MDIVGSSVEIQISDPFDLGVLLDGKPLIGKLLAYDAPSDEDWNVLIRLNEPFDYSNAHCEYFVGGPRHVGTSLRAFVDGSRPFCSFTHISKERAQSQTPMDLTWWRGGIGIIGNLKMV